MYTNEFIAGWFGNSAAEINSTEMQKFILRAEMPLSIRCQLNMLHRLMFDQLLYADLTESQGDC